MDAASAKDRETAQPPQIPQPAGLRDLAANYDGYILDLWGVMHDGVTAFPDAVDCVQRLRARGARVAILSNAPRRSATVTARNAELGIAPDLADVVVSSGEDAWQHLKDRSDPFYAALGRRVFHLGPDRDRDLLAGNDLEPVAEPEAADFILNTGPDASDARVADFEPLLRRCLQRGLPMVCANPDLMVMRGGKPEICAGATAARYEELGGKVRYHGKPDARVYARCFAAMAEVPKRRILAVGDSLRTDMAGAAAAGIDGLFVAGGIHAEELGFPAALDVGNKDEGDRSRGDRVDARRVAEACRKAGVAPVGVLPHFHW